MLKLRRQKIMVLDSKVVVSVLCGSKSGNSEQYYQSSFDIGRELASHDVETLCGGVNAGLMHALISGAYSKKGKVKGFVCSDPSLNELPSGLLEEVVFVESVQERKSALMSGADRYILLPGGLGVMDEFFEVLASSKSMGRSITVGILNVDGYFSPFLEFLQVMVSEGFVNKKYIESIFVDKDPVALVSDILQQ